MNLSRSREATIGVAPYGDGSGYQARVNAWDENGVGAVVAIEMSYYIEANDWPALRQAVEEALALAGWTETDE